MVDGICCVCTSIQTSLALEILNRRQTGLREKKMILCSPKLITDIFTLQMDVNLCNYAYFQYDVAPVFISALSSASPQLTVCYRFCCLLILSR
jgi:hypothetical protein